jgi:hypothetical protein
MTNRLGFKKTKTFVILTLFVISCCTGMAQENKPTVIIPSNLSMIQKATATTIDSIFNNYKYRVSESFYISTENFENNWLPKQVLTNYISEKGYHVYDNISDTSYSLRINSFQSNLYYGKSFKENIFGVSKTERKINVELSLTLTNNSTKEILSNSLFRSSVKDTVEVDMIQDLENKSLPITHAPYPQENIINRVAEPFVILAATGIVVYLFYNVRTK